MSPSTSNFDLIIIGAGINGAGIARDASMRGLKVLLLDKGDVGSGTSSWSTRLVHGGLRYLEHGELGLVRESLRERETLLRIAPHLVKPIPIFIPIYKNGRRGRVKIRVGMFAYDLLSLDKSLPRHHILSRREIIQQVPGMDQVGLVGGAQYYDCQVTFAERLVLENVLSARESGAEVLTYSNVIRVSDGLVEFQRKEIHETESARAPVVVNATGPWVDCVNGTETYERLIGGTKGSHIVVRPFAGCPSSTVYVEAESDARPFFVIPWNNLYLIGTTDVRFEANPDEVRAEDWEVDYLLKETNRVFPDARLVVNDVCYTYSGVRPLPYSRTKTEQSITRRHFIHESHNFLSVVGGKLTTYRSLAEECVDVVFRKLKKSPVECLTAQVVLPGGAEPKRQGVPERLLKIYGSRSEELLRLCNTNLELLCPLVDGSDVLAGEIVFAFQEELAETLADCLLRRTMVGLNCDLGVGADDAAAQIARQFLNWSEQKAKTEVEGYRRLVKKMSLDCN